jgi:hypothetical protein
VGFLGKTSTTTKKKAGPLSLLSNNLVRIYIPSRQTKPKSNQNKSKSNVKGGMGDQSFPG